MTLIPRPQDRPSYRGSGSMHLPPGPVGGAFHAAAGDGPASSLRSPGENPPQPPPGESSSAFPVAACFIIAIPVCTLLVALLWSSERDAARNEALRAVTERDVLEARARRTPTVAAREPATPEEPAQAEPAPRAATPSLTDLLEAGPLHAWVDPAALGDVLEMVTPEGLYARTSDWYDQEDFLGLTGDALALLVPDSGYAFGGQRTLLEYLGGLPSRADCDRALTDLGVQRALQAVVALELPVNSLALTPNEARTDTWRKGFDALQRALDARELALARELERATGYPHWIILRRTFASWMKQP